MTTTERLVEVRDKLMRMLMYFSAIEPEDAAQTIMLRAHMAGGFDHPDYYWLMASRNQAIEQYRQRKVRKFIVPITEHVERTATREFVVGEPDLMADVPLPDEDKTWLLEYYGRKGNAKKDHIRAFRLRRKAHRGTTDAAAPP